MNMASHFVFANLNRGMWSRSALANAQRGWLQPDGTVSISGRCTARVFRTYDAAASEITRLGLEHRSGSHDDKDTGYVHSL